MAKTLTGIVSSNKADKTIVITVTTRKTHPIYKKQYTVSTKYMAHDEKNDCQVGDKVVIAETRPISARKRYNLQTVVQRAVLSEKDKDVIKGEEVTETNDKSEEVNK
jgi:small subunit ribosomal protein S17